MKKRARVSRVAPPPVEDYIKIEAHLSIEDAKHMRNWLAYIDRNYWSRHGSFGPGLQDLLSELNMQLNNVSL